MAKGNHQKKSTNGPQIDDDSWKDVVHLTSTRLPVLYYPKFEPDQRWLRSVLLLVDNVVRIIPEDADHTDSDPTKQLSDAMPGCLQNIPPTKDDIAVDFINFNRLEKAFTQISTKFPRRPRKKYRFRLGIDGSVRAEGHVWLSNSKLEPRIRELLIKYNLADKGGPFAQMAPFKNAVFANEEASGLIVSHIADRIARRTGLDTMTDEALPFVVRSLDALGVTDKSLDREGEGALASTIANSLLRNLRAYSGRYLLVPKAYVCVVSAGFSFSKSCTAVPGFNGIAVPRSEIFASKFFRLSSRHTMMLVGLMSKWRMSRAWIYTRPSKSWSKITSRSLASFWSFSGKSFKLPVPTNSMM